MTDHKKNAWAIRLIHLQKRLENRTRTDASGTIGRFGGTWTKSSGPMRGRDEAGAVLILALIFLTVISTLVLTLAGWTTNDLSNSITFSANRSLDASATSAMDLAIQNIRYTPLLYTSSADQTLNASPPSVCWGTGSTSELTSDGNTFAVWCSTTWTPSSANTRVVTLSACPTNRTTSPVVCALDPLLQATVTFDDYPAGVSAPNSAECVVYCGTAMTENNWDWSPTVPTVTSLPGATTGPIYGGTGITIDGTGFVQNETTVNFVETNLTNNVIFPATSVSVNSADNVITAFSPAITTGSTFYVTVTTPGGTSAYDASGDTFTYTSVVPSITSFTPNAGTVIHGTSMTITGRGFFDGATVTFTPVGGGTASQATAVNVVSGTTITDISPPVETSGNYYVTVTTTYGTSAVGPTFKYS